MDQAAVAAMLAELDSAGIDVGRVRAWIHSHAAFNVFWSATDVRTIEALATGDWLASLVVNKAGARLARVDVTFPVRATFDEVATIAVPRLAQAAERNVSTIDKLMAVLDESVRVMRDYPLAVAFDRAIRAESPRDLQLAENSDVRFMALHSLIRDILEQGARENALAPGVDVDSAAGAIFLIFRGLNEYAAGTPPAAEYHATVVALKQLLRGRLFGLA